MGLKTMQIFFDNPHAAYYVGQAVTGRVVVSLDAPKKIRSITIKFRGEAEVRWQESESQTDRDGKSQTVDVNYDGSETYFENKFFLVGNANGEVELPSGDHSYPFSCTLPATLPSSFEGEFGHVRYTVKATLDRPWKFDQESKVAFTVVSPLDLNVMPQVKEPVHLEEGKTFCCLFCKSGPLQLIVTLPASGYVPGQTIPFNIEIDNNSNVEVENVKCVLRKEVKWYSRTPTRQEKITKTPIAELSLDQKVPPDTSKTLAKDIQIPPLPPSNLNNCSIIDLQYIFKVEAIVTSFHSNLNARIPIVLGTIPLLSGPTAFNPGQVPVAPVTPVKPVAPDGHPSEMFPLIDGSANPSANPSPTLPAGGWNLPPSMPLNPSPMGPGGYPPSPNVPAPVAPAPGGYAPPIGMTTNISGPTGPHAPSAPPLYPSLPPPSYEESMFGGKNIKDSTDSEHTIGLTNFAPKYPVWNFSPQNQ